MINLNSKRVKKTATATTRLMTWKEMAEHDIILAHEKLNATRTVINILLIGEIFNLFCLVLLLQK
jgi:hypothetical protein